MSEENVNTVLAMLSAFNRGNMDGYFASFDPEIEYHDTPGFPGPGVHHGLEAVRRHVEDYREAWVEPRVETEEIRSVGDRVVTRSTYTGVGKSSGATAETSASGVFDFRDGRIVRLRQFIDHADALQAVGLSE
jgi:ketosteroid isomerase-like protein